MIRLETRGITKSYGRKPALRGVDLSLEGGQIVGLLGPNASGKTTLLKILSGLLPVDGGTMAVAGETGGHALKARVSFLPDEMPLPAWMRVDDAFAYMRDTYTDYDAHRAAELRSLMGLLENERYRALSKGMKERLSLAMALSRRADVYLLDEPLGGVDPAGKRKIIDAIVRMPLDERLMVISTHLVREVESLLDRVVFLQSGRVGGMEACEALRERGRSIEDAYMEVFEP